MAVWDTVSVDLGDGVVRDYPAELVHETKSLDDSSPTPDDDIIDTYVVVDTVHGSGVRVIQKRRKEPENMAIAVPGIPQVSAVSIDYDKLAEAMVKAQQAAYAAQQAATSPAPSTENPSTTG